MGRIRTIKPEFWTDEEIAGLSEAAQLLALALLNYADDEGYFNANPALIKASCFPLREPSVSLQGMLSELSMIGFAGIGKTSDGKSYGHIANFAKHQRINRPTPSKIKTLTIAWDDSERIHGGLTKPSMNTHGVLTEPSPQEGKGKEGKGETRPQIPEPPQDGPILDDAHPLQMANHIIETLGLPWHRQLQIQLAECIKAKAKNAGISLAEAHDCILNAALTVKASEDEPEVWLFWFRDRRYEKAKKVAASTTSRNIMVDNPATRAAAVLEEA